MKEQIFEKQYEGLVGPFFVGKILAHKSALDRINLGDIPVPITVEVDLADGFCNNKCSHCCFGNDKQSTPIFIKKEALIRTITDLSGKGLKAVELVGGGEPTTHPEFKEIVESLSQLGLDIGLVTNGLLLYQYRDILHLFSFIRISLDAGSEEVYFRTHGVDNFQSLIDNLLFLIRKRYINAKKVGLGYLVMPNNIEDIEAAAELAARLKLRYIQYRPAALDHILAPQDIEIVKNRIRKLRLKYQREDTLIISTENSWRQLEVERKLSSCHGSSLIMVIMADGSIPLCNLKRRDSDYILGNIYTSSVEEIWFSENHKNLCNSINTHSCPLPCKIDTYNIYLHALKNDTMDINFV